FQDEELARVRADAIVEASALLSDSFVRGILREQATTALAEPTRSLALAELLSDVVHRVKFERRDDPLRDVIERLLDLLSSSEIEHRRVGAYLIPALQKLGAIDHDGELRIGSVLWKDGSWPQLGIEANPHFLLAWSGDHRERAYEVVK